MWEWSNRLLRKKDSEESKSLLAAYNDLLLQNAYAPEPLKKNVSAQKNSSPETTPVPERMQQLLNQRLEEYALNNLTLKECVYDPQTWQEMSSCFTEYQKIRKIFLKLLGYSYASECTKAGLTKADIKLLRQSIAPENYNTHIKIPFDFGGGLDFDNLCLIKTHPCHGIIHKLIDLQIENGFLRTYKKIYIPWFEGKIYHD
ncbi:MAG: hypothetical protein ACLSFR_01165 [Alphaproteobacteria bacterium]|jgi:hypothetical protein|nr:hypothetical protein [Alphaproteobacteria bacterium]CCZ31210.1 uncharacterized protein BN682_01113 [Proteobacteria bacterium CAG:495]